MYESKIRAPIFPTPGITCRPFEISRNGSEGTRIRCKKCGNKVRIEPVDLEKVAAYKGKAQQRESLLLFLMSLVTGAGLALMGVRSRR